MPMLARIVTLALLALQANATADDGVRERYETLADAYERSEREAVDIDSLLVSLTAIVDELESAGYDSLAIGAVTRVQGLHVRRGETDEARRVLARGIVIAERSDRRRERAQLGLAVAVTHAIDGDFESFVDTASDLLAVFVELEEWPLATVCWFNMGVAYAKLGRAPEALACIDEAMTLARRIGDRSRLGSCYAMAADLNLNAGRVEVATALTDSAVAITREVGRAVPLGAALTVQALVYDEQGDVDRALRAVGEAIAVRRRIGDEVWIHLSQLQRGLLLLRAGRPTECEALMDSILPALVAQGDPTSVHTANELRCQALFDSGRTAEAERELASRIDRFEADRGSLHVVESQAGFYATGGEYYATLARSLNDRGDVEAAWRTVERGHAAVLTSHAASDSLAGRADLSRVRERLAMREGALLQFSDPRMNPLLAFLITADGIDSFELEDTGDLVRDARHALDLLASGAPDDVCRPVLDRLAVALDVDRWHALPPTVTRLYLVPPSALAGFPFEALPLPDGRDVGERFAVSYVPSATWLVTSGTASSMRGIRAWADPDFATRFAEPSAIESQIRVMAATPLPEARREVQVLRGPDTDVFEGAGATRERVVTSGVGASVLHFATHAVVNPYAPERSCLLLAGGDGRLEAQNIESLTLHADLVTLSGCETSGGYTYLGEGTFGLTRSFVLAGARAVVSSLWKVEDGAAARFMERFYAHARAGSAIDVSLREARRTLRREGYSYRDRSAFVLTGAGHEPLPALAALGPVRGAGARVRRAAGLLALVLGVGLVGTLVRRRRGAA